MEFLRNTSFSILQSSISVLAVLTFFVCLFYTVSSISKRVNVYAKGSTFEEHGVINEEKVHHPELLQIIRERFKRDKYASFAHDLIMMETCIYMLMFIISVIQVLLKATFNIVFLRGVAFGIHALILNITGFLVFCALVIFISRRLLGTRKRLERTAGHMVPLLIFFTFILLGFVFEGIKVIAYKEYSFLSPIGLILSNPLKHLLGQDGTFTNWYFIVSILYVLFGGLLLALIPNSKFIHMIAHFKKTSVAVNRGRIKNTELAIDKLLTSDVELGEDISFGINTISDIPAEQLALTDSCADCGRCEESCPAFKTGKNMSQRKMVKIMKNLMDENQKGITKKINDVPEIKDMIWECSMCYSCEENCPLLIETVDTNVALRRNAVLNTGEIKSEHKELILNIEKFGNPYGASKDAYSKMISELGLPTLGQVKQVDYLLWIGCHGYSDVRMKSVLASLVNILKGMGVKFAVLENEPCCGDTLRRIGAEYKFQEMVHKNIELFNSLKIKNILAVCPHCYNTLKKDYATFGSKISVKHYLEIIDIAENPSHKEGLQKKKVFYHDSCYLSKLNRINEQPHQILSKLSSEYNSVPHGEVEVICCGGGGGRMWIEEKVSERASMLQLEKLQDKGVDIIATSCPYCLSMFSDAVKTKGLNMEVKDLVELIK